MCCEFLVYQPALMGAAAETSLKLELSDVCNTALVTLHCRALESQSADPMLTDLRAEKLIHDLRPRLLESSLPLHRSLAAGKVEAAMQTYVALRSRRFDRYAGEFLEEYPEGRVVNLGCGLDTRRWRLNSERVIDVDLPPMADLRIELLRAPVIACDVREHRWMDAVAERADGPLLVLAEGLFMYLPEDEVRGLVEAMADKFPGCRMVAEVFNRFWLGSDRREQIESRLQTRLGFGSNARFVSGLSESAELEKWDSRFRLLDEWSFVDENEPKLGRLRKLRHFPQFRKRQWVVCYSLGGRG